MDVEEAEVLVHHTEPSVVSLDRTDVSRGDLTAVDGHLAGVRAVHARQALQHARLARPVAAQQRVNGRGPQEQAGVIQRLGATEALVDPPGLEGESPRDPGGVREVG